MTAISLFGVPTNATRRKDHYPELVADGSWREGAKPRKKDSVFLASASATLVMTIASNERRPAVSGTQRKTGQLGLRDRDCLSNRSQRLQLTRATFCTKKWRVGQDGAAGSGGIWKPARKAASFRGPENDHGFYL